MDYIMSIINPSSFVKGKLPYWFVLGLIMIERNWKQTGGNNERKPIAKPEFLKASILSKKNRATPKSWMKVNTWAASWASEKNEDNIKQKLNTASISKK